MSLESLGSLARTVSDRFLRDNLRRIISGKNVTISSVLDGFRSHGSTEDCSEPQPVASAFEEFARGGSYTRQGSDGFLKRRNSSVGRRPGQQPRAAPELHTIYSAASLGYPISPRAQRKPAGKQHKQQQKQQRRWHWSRIATAAMFIAWAILGIWFLTGTWLPHQGTAMVEQEGQSQAASWRLLSLLHPGSHRQLLEDGQEKLRQMGTAPHRHTVDAFSAAAARVQEQQQAGRWGQHMASRMSRSLAEGDTSAAGSEGAAATAEAPSIAAAATFVSGVAAQAVSAAARNSASVRNGAATGSQSAAVAGASGSSGGSGASVGGAAFSGVSLLQRDGLAGQEALNTAATAAEGRANTLQYSNGYVNVTGRHYRVVEHTQNRDVCAAACAGDSVCAAWTRIAAGRADVQACYLKSAVADLAASASAAVQYVAPSQVSQLVLESGTKDPSALPAALYGCPYPPSRNGGCRPPPTCNCYQGVCYGDC